MNAFNSKDFNDRRTAAADAKKAALEKFRAQPKPDAPEVLARIAERKAISDAREARAAERELIRKAEAERLAAEAEARRLEQLAIEEAAAAAKAAAAVLEREMEIERKKARDAKYAARKARR
jgi:hypothetical protein